MGNQQVKRGDVLPCSVVVRTNPIMLATWEDVHDIEVVKNNKQVFYKIRTIKGDVTVDADMVWKQVMFNNVNCKCFNGSHSLK